mmetsp:Transcript_79370/g.233192  ORF Transcript_79370/g.233192 Transcript_79370/m.233192 type:complete len:449 (+) Transcript_79370:114-1460(+)
MSFAINHGGARCLARRLAGNSLRSIFCSAVGSRRLLAARDAYAVMGIERHATGVEVKARFRELAKQYHPDLNKGDRSASMKMAELTSAYDTLMDPKKRAALDQATAGAETGAAGSSANPFAGFGQGEEWVSPSQMFSEFQDIFGRASPHRPQSSGATATRGEDVSSQLEVSFLEAMQGCEKVVSLMLRQSCGECRGTGAREGTAWSTCRVCRGSGVQRVERGILSMGVPCHRCQGTGEVLDHPCRFCRGEGTRLQPRDVRVSIPAGVRNLMELRVAGAGHAGSRGGKAGHLFVTVKVLAHERFRRVDDDVHLDVPLTLRQALLGGEVQIPTLQGATEPLVIQAPAQPGATKVLRGRGPPRLGAEGRGHVVLHFLLRLPQAVSPRQVALIEEFDALTSEAGPAAPGAGPSAGLGGARAAGAGARAAGGPGAGFASQQPPQARARMRRHG